MYHLKFQKIYRGVFENEWENNVANRKFQINEDPSSVSRVL